MGKSPTRAWTSCSTTRDGWGLKPRPDSPRPINRSSGRNWPQLHVEWNFKRPLRDLSFFGLRQDAFVAHQLGIPRVVEIFDFGSRQKSAPYLIQSLVDPCAVEAKKNLKFGENAKQNSARASHMAEYEVHRSFFYLGPVLVWHVALELKNGRR